MVGDINLEKEVNYKIQQIMNKVGPKKFVPNYFQNVIIKVM